MPVHYCITILGIRVPLCGTVMEPQHPLECDKQQERHEYLFLLNLIMLINSNDSNAANNSNGNRTANPPKWVSTPHLNCKPHSMPVEKSEEPKECYTTSRRKKRKYRRYRHLLSEKVFLIYILFQKDVTWQLRQ